MALPAFTRLGYEAATVADVRAAAGVSNGSVFHRFGSKEGIAEALYIDGIIRRHHPAQLVARGRIAGLRARPSGFAQVLADAA